MLPVFRRAPRVLVEPLSSADASACASIHRKCFAHPWTHPELESMAASAGSVAHSAIDSRTGRLLGFVISRKVLDEAEVLTIAVDPDFRKLGVGATLLDGHVQSLAIERVRWLFLEVDEGNVPARKLYAKFGFSEVGRRAGYYRKPDGGRAEALTLRKQII